MVVNTQQLLKKLTKQLDALREEVIIHDKNLNPWQKKLLQDTERFNNELFIQHGAILFPCITQIHSNICQLEKLIKLKVTKQAIELSCAKIEDRFTAVKRAINSTTTNINIVKQQKANARARYARKSEQAHAETEFDWIASSVMQNSHAIYEELNKHFNWARKIEQKIAKMESNLENCHSTDKIKLQNDILLMHRRLGKCRQAIRYIEDRIQTIERPYQSNNR
nr:primosomal replication protein [Shewanella septentrionalis]